MKQSPDLTTAQERMKPGVITSCGFLGPDRRNLIEILVEDEALVQRLNTTHKKIAQRMKKGTIVTILPDRGDRYLSTTLFRSVCGKCPP